MSIIRWQPFLTPFDDMEKMFEGLMPTTAKGFTPAVDVYLDKDNVVVETPLAGVKPDDVEITIENDVLTIRGKMEQQSEVDEKNYYRREIRSGSFYRSVALPAHVQGEKAEASSHDGMLKVTVPRAEEAKPKTIKVTAK